MEPANRRSTPICNLSETQPFVELRRRARRQQDSLRAAKGIVLGLCISTAIWATAFAVATAWGVL